jgi:hypothetical protein
MLVAARFSGSGSLHASVDGWLSERLRWASPPVWSPFERISGPVREGGAGENFSVATQRIILHPEGWHLCLRRPKVSSGSKC